MTIQPSGETTEVAILSDELEGATVGACVVEIVRTFRYDPGPAEGPRTYEFPFLFEPLR